MWSNKLIFVFSYHSTCVLDITCIQSAYESWSVQLGLEYIVVDVHLKIHHPSAALFWSFACGLALWYLGKSDITPLPGLQRLFKYRLLVLVYLESFRDLGFNIICESQVWLIAFECPVVRFMKQLSHCVLNTAIKLPLHVLLSWESCQNLMLLDHSRVESR